MRKLMGLMIVLSLLLAGGCGSKEWKPYTSKEGGFTVLFPGEPAKADTPGNGVMYAARVSGGEVSVAYATMPMVPSGDAEQMRILHAARDGSLRSGKATLKSSTDGKYDGCNAVDYTGFATAENQWFVAKAFIKGSRLYFVAYGGPKSFIDSAEAKQFMTSFKLD